MTDGSRTWTKAKSLSATTNYLRVFMLLAVGRIQEKKISLQQGVIMDHSQMAIDI